MMMNYPLLFTPVYKDYIWGGNRIPALYHRDMPDGICAESWEITDRPEGMSVVSNGPLAGSTLRELMESDGPGLVGTCYRGGTFPLLVKIIDARQKLSVQVHPNDDNAAGLGGEPKTEMWYMLDGSDDAAVYAGLRRGTTSNEFAKAIADDDLEQMLVSIPVSTGDAVFVPGGRVHAIDAGCLLLEIQQNSNTTYRVYDWGRKGHDGKPRALHVEQALDAIDWADGGDAKISAAPFDDDANSIAEVVACSHFRVERLGLIDRMNAANEGSSFHGLFVASGNAVVSAGGEEVSIAAGTSCLVPAMVADYSLDPVGGAAQVIRITVPS
jgi:mannose-6-phosphate isomerase